MKRTVRALVVLGAAAGLYQGVVLASGSSMPAPTSSGPSTPTRTPEEMAIASYNSGIEHKDKGIKIEESAAATADAKDHAKAIANAKKEYDKALKDFKSAASNSPDMYQAYNGMGFSYRKTGDYVKALEMYDKALQLNPGFADAIEYRGEAYLGLNRIDDAKQAYLQILASDRKQADTLMAAMKIWVQDHKAAPGAVDAATISGLETWIGERAEIAKDTVAMGLSHGPSW